jgi:hypothetical protein
MTDELQEQQPEAEETIDSAMESSPDEPTTEAEPTIETQGEGSEESGQGEESDDQGSEEL